MKSLTLKGVVAFLVLPLMFAGEASRGAEAPKPPAEPPGPVVWTFPSNPPRIHIARGLWWDFWRLHEAIAHTGGAICEASWESFGHTQGYGSSGATLADFPKTYVELQRYNVIILTGNRAASLPEAAQKRLKLWVENGGGLLMLGSLQTFGSGGWHGTVLEEALPVTVPGKPDFTKAGKRLCLEPTPAGAAIFGSAVPWAHGPRVYFHHQGLEPRAGAEVWATAGGLPMMVSRSCGKGRVVTMAATICGEPEPGDIPLWDWDGLPVIFAKTVEWLGRPTRTQVPATQTKAPAPAQAHAGYEAKKAELSELSEVNVEELIGDVEGSAGNRPGRNRFSRIRELAASCADSGYALAVVRALADSGSPFSAREVDGLYARLRPFLGGAEFKAPALQMTEAGNSGQMALGLRLLGSLKAPECRTLVPPVVSRGLASLDRPGTAFLDAPDGEDEYLRLAAVLAATDAGDAALLPSLNTAQFPQPEEASPLNMVRERLVESAMIARCLLGDRAAAVSTVRAVIQNRLDYEAALDVTQTWRSGPVSRADAVEIGRCAASLPSRKARVRELQEYCAQMPSVGLAAVAEAGNQWEGEFAMECLLGALAGREDRSVDRGVMLTFLKRVRIPEVRALCINRLLPDAAGEVGAVLEGFAAGPADEAMSALRLVPWLPRPQRAAVLRVAANHPDPSVKARAAAWQKSAP